MRIFRMSLLDNSNDFLKEALSKAIAAETDQAQWKFAVFCLVQSIELSLKERLRREHEILIYENIDKPKRTVTLLQALDRLSSISKISILKSDIDAIKTASVWRNNILHYEFEFSVTSAKLVFARLFSFLSDFDRKHFELKIDELIPWDLFKEAVVVREYSEELYKRAEERFREENIEKYLIWICRYCGCDSFVIQDEINMCYVCGQYNEVERCERCGELGYKDELHEEIEADHKSLTSFTFYLCESCSEEVWKPELDAYQD